MVVRSQFSERVFEFAFNAEFAAANSAVLAACPDLPTQQDEKRLGYDVEFKIKSCGGAVQSLLLQHKVVRYVSTKSRSNAHFFDAARGPYFAFGLNVDQFNLIRALRIRMASRGSVDQIYYCAPLFAARSALNNHYAHKKIRQQSAWIDIAGSPALSAAESHCIVLAESGSNATLFSEDPRKLEVALPLKYERPKGLDKRGTSTMIKELYAAAFDAMAEWWPSRQLSQSGNKQSDNEIIDAPRIAFETIFPERYRDDDASGLIDALGYLMARFYGLSWMLVCEHPAELLASEKTAAS